MDINEKNISRRGFLKTAAAIGTGNGGHHGIALKTLVRFADATDDLVEVVFAEPPIALTEVLYSDVSVHSLLSCKSLMVFRK